MRKLSVSEFAQFCNEKKPDCFVFATDNQDDTYAPHMKLILRFKNIVIGGGKDRICFMRGSDSMCFNNVKMIQIHDDKPSIGTVFDIVCSGLDSCVKYTLIAD